MEVFLLRRGRGEPAPARDPNKRQQVLRRLWKRQAWNLGEAARARVGVARLSQQGLNGCGEQDLGSAMTGMCA